MKVYIVTSETYHHTSNSIEGVFTTLEKAKQFMSSLNDRIKDSGMERVWLTWTEEEVR